MNKQLGVRCAVAVITLLLFGSAAYADGLRLRIDDSGAGVGVVISDNGAGDSDSTLGSIAFSGTVGDFTFNHVYATAAPGQLNLTSDHYWEGWESSSTLRITLEATNFVGSPGATGTMGYSVAPGDLYATDGSSATFQGWVNTGNAVPNFGADHATAAALPGITGLPPAGSLGTTPITMYPRYFDGDSTSLTFTETDHYSMFSQVTATFKERQTESWIAFSTSQGVANPEPTSLLLLGSGLASLGFFGRKKKTS